MNATTLEQAKTGMIEMMYGDKPASLRFALMTAAMSSVQDLESNGYASRFLAQFAASPLPTDREEVYQGLKLSGCKRIFHSHINALYSIDALWLAGVLDAYTVLPSDFEGQKKWRGELVALIKGMAEKTVSFAALIYQPLECELVPIDRHHLRRYGLDPDKSLKGAKYLALELTMVAERNQEGFSQVPLGIYTAAYWGVQRDGDDCYTGETTSHKNLSCRWY